MGVRDIILLLLALILTGIMIAVGIFIFSGQSAQANKDGLTAKLLSLGAHAYQFKMRPVVVGGGGGVYDNSHGAPSIYTIPEEMKVDDNGRYLVTSVTATTCVIRGTSTLNESAVVFCTVNDVGRTSFSYQGW